jgi:hypothetical protein
MVSAHVVDLAVEYLDECQSTGRLATLVGMHWYIDGRNKTLPLLDEVNEALTQRPQVFVSRRSGDVTFSDLGAERSVTADDMRQADKRYRTEFSKELRRLRNDA